MKRRKLIIDCDPGHDDAVALVLALACAELDILGISIVGGNHTVDKVARNALQVLEVCGKPEIPVAVGRSGPLLQKLVLGEKFHGKSGMDGHSLPQPETRPASGDAVGFLADLLARSEEPVTLAVTGPFTNIAVLLLTHPHLRPKIESIYMMGGSYYRGNWSAIAEFNVWIDPESADVLLRSGIPFFLHGLDLTHQAYITREEYAALRVMDNPVSNFVADLLDFYSISCIDQRKHPGCLMHDACALAGLIDPTLFHYENRAVRMDLNGRHTRGGCLIDMRPVRHAGRGEPAGRVATAVERERMVELVLSSCRRLGEEVLGG